MKCAAMLVFAVPAAPEISTLLARKYPLPPNISSSHGMPVEIRSEVAVCSSWREVIGRTAIPRRSIRKGYSLVP
jgi:hypothetical protein